MKHQIESFDVELPTNLDMLVGMVRKTADEQSSAWLQSITIRMPMVVFTTLEALATYSGQSRNKLIVKSLESAFDHIWEQLPEDERMEIESLRSTILTQKMEQHQKDPSKTESGEL